MAWFSKRSPSRAPDALRRQIPDGLWVKCDGCAEVLYRDEYDRSLGVCPRCGHHHRIGAPERLEQILDPESFEAHDENLLPADPLGFCDSKPYEERLQASQASTGLGDALVAGMGRIEGRLCSVGVFEFAFMGGSMGSVVGEGVTRVFERAVEHRAPALVFSCSGGARMQEGILSLMQMAKASVALARLRDERLPYLSVLLHPTTGGVAASFAMQGDILLAEPGALIGFAGPRVIEQTLREKLPEGFQRAEFNLAHGMIDLIVDRRELRSKLAQLLRLLLS
jgi:acetyl-CoA carboxylase carboxyl transferase subunit beta